MSKKYRSLEKIRADLETAKNNVAKYTKELKETQEHELIKGSNDMFNEFKKVAGEDSRIEEMLEFFRQSIENAKPDDFSEETDAIATAENDETEAVEETDEVDTSSLFENTIY